ncbi:MAG: nucleotide exchange factor GrpE [Thermodesulfobacteriota bacterium]
MSKDKEYTEQEAKEPQEQEQTLQEEQEQVQARAELSQEELRQLCEERICPECPQRAEMDQEMLRVRADAENFRKRMSKEKEQYCKYATESILEDIIPVIDNLELAAQHGRDVQACQDLVQGVDMTIKMFLETLKKHGLEQVQSQEGDEFDPAWHEAMAQEERSDLENGQICQVMQQGYRIKDRLLRPAKVVVSKKCET